MINILLYWDKIVGGDILENLARVIGFDKQFLIQAAFQFLNSLVCFAILYYLLYKPVLKFMSARQEKIKNKIKDAEQASNEANNLKKEYEMLLKKNYAEASKIIEMAKEQAKIIIAQANNDADKIKKQARFEIENERNQAQASMKKEIINGSWLVINNFLLSDNISQNLHNELNQKYLEAMKNIDLDNKIKKVD